MNGLQLIAISMIAFWIGFIPKSITTIKTCGMNANGVWFFVCLYTFITAITFLEAYPKVMELLP